MYYSAVVPGRSKLITDSLQRSHSVGQRSAVPIAVHDISERTNDGNLAQLVCLERQKVRLIL
ncbi:hypothetical protein D3C75_1057520 [compost metagenome]